jgi:NAD(P)H-dependent flavin oxidoreductase YrpB (nitropropane dioxygenase family)
MHSQRMRLSALAVFFIASACTAHNPLILKHTTDVREASASVLLEHELPVLVTSSSLPEYVVYEPVARIEVGKAWYGRTRSVEAELARQARALGADAVVEVETWHQPSGYAWWAPHGRGQAVRIIEGATLADLEGLGSLQ